MEDEGSALPCSIRACGSVFVSGKIQVKKGFVEMAINARILDNLSPKIPESNGCPGKFPALSSVHKRSLDPEFEAKGQRGEEKRVEKKGAYLSPHDSPTAMGLKTDDQGTHMGVAPPYPQRVMFASTVRFCPAPTLMVWIFWKPRRSPKGGDLSIACRTT
jgi:hypothetical protein